MRCQATPSGSVLRSAQMTDALLPISRCRVPLACTRQVDIPSSASLLADRNHAAHHCPSLERAIAVARHRSPPRSIPPKPPKAETLGLSAPTHRSPSDPRFACAGVRAVHRRICARRWHARCIAARKRPRSRNSGCVPIAGARPATWKTSAGIETPRVHVVTSQRRTVLQKPSR